MAAIYVSQHKKKAYREGGDIYFEDEASFRQDSTLHQTWSRIASQPHVQVTGARNSVKAFGAVSLDAHFIYGENEVFNADTYLQFLEHFARSCRKSRTHQIHLIQDNASYHKDATVWSWFSKNRHWLTVHQLPPYSPELNATERLWHHVRLAGTHNRYFITKTELHSTLMAVFHNIQDNPHLITGYLRPFI